MGSILGSVSLKENFNREDEIARICAWAERLDELGRADEARRVLRDAMERLANPVAVTLKLAELVNSAEAADLLRKALGDEPGNVPAAQTLAKILLEAGKADEAARVIAELGSAAAESAGLAELIGEIRMAEGRYAEALAAFGPRGSLSARGRRLRRRSWWLSRGPLRRRPGQDRAVVDAPPSDTAAHSLDVPETVLEVVAWAKWLSGQGRHDDARQVISEALAEHGRQPALLICAAGIEDSADAGNTALYLWREAYREVPGDVDAVRGLAMRLTHTLVSPSLTYRVSDALRVLDSFPDQNHPEIRTARADALRFNDAWAARVLAAYGPRRGLSWSAARSRRSFWWRSAGPLGQLFLRVGDRIRPDLPVAAKDDLVRRTEAESEAVGRTLDSIAELAPSAARERIEDAWRQHGRTPSLLLAYADADASDRAGWHSLAITAEAARSVPDSLDAVCRLAWALDLTYGYGPALQVVQSLSAAARETTEARVFTGNLHGYARNFALAAAAYGDPRDLDGYDRRSRRRCARKARARFFLSGSRGDVDAIDPASFDPVPPAIAQVLDQCDRMADEPTIQREAARNALEEHGRHPLLLLALARAERVYGDRHACAALAEETIGRASGDPLTMDGAIGELWLADYEASALRTITDLSDEVKSSPTVSSTTGEILRHRGLRATAVTAFGRTGLDAWRWRTRRACWWRSGGPLVGIRSSIETAEDELLSALTLPPLKSSALTTLPLSAAVTEAVRDELANYQLVEAYWSVFRPKVFGRWMDRIFVAASTVIIFVAAALAEVLRWPTAGIAGGLGAAAAIAAAEAAALWMLFEVTRRVASWISIATACGVGAALVLRISGRPAFGAGLALSALAFVMMAAYLLREALWFSRRIRFLRWQRKEAETAVLSALLELIGELMLPQQRREASVRQAWMDQLERIAAAIERGLTYALRGGDPDSQGAISAHARGAAAALRGMKNLVALPNATAWQDLIARLTALATALANNDFANWPPPLPDVTAPRASRPLWRQVLDTGRTVLVIFGPPLVAYLLPLAVPLNGPGLSWLRFATIVWALLGAVIALDPAWTERITKMRQGLDLLRTATPPKGFDGSPALDRPADAAQTSSQAARRPVPNAPRSHKSRRRR